MDDAGRVAYDEFGMFHENAAEYGLAFDEPPKVRRVDVEVEPGRTLSSLVWGEGDPELVFLHGGWQNAHTWDTVAMALRPRPLLAIDAPGHGHSDGPNLLHVANRDGMTPAAEQIAVVIRELAPNAKGVIGMSMGGATLIALTTVAPELVRKVLLVDVLPAHAPELSNHIRAFANGPATFPDFQQLLDRTLQFNPSRSESSLRRGILHNAQQLEDGSWVWRHSRDRIGETLAPEAVLGAAASSPPAGGSSRDDSGYETLAAIKVPVLLARGLRPDSVLRDEDEAELRRRLPSAEVVHFPEAGHSIQGDMPLELAATIDRFIP